MIKQSPACAGPARSPIHPPGISSVCWRPTRPEPGSAEWLVSATDETGPRFAARRMLPEIAVFAGGAGHPERHSWTRASAQRPLGHGLRQTNSFQAGTSRCTIRRSSARPRPVFAVSTRACHPQTLLPAPGHDRSFMNSPSRMVSSRSITLCWLRSAQRRSAAYSPGSADRARRS